MSELLAIGEAILAAEKREVEHEDVVLAVSELRAALPAIEMLLGRLESRLTRLEMRAIELNRAVSAARIRRPVRDASGAIQYVVDQIQEET